MSARETERANESTHELLDAVKKGCTQSIPTRAPTMLARFVSVGIIVIFLILISIQIASTKNAIRRSSELEKTYISFSELDIDKDEYSPGDLVGFKYTRYAKVEGAYPVIYLSIDCFENIDTGEIFPGISGARVVKESGSMERHGLRPLPIYATPGRYKIEGCVSSQTSRLTSAQAYSSEVFLVKARQQPSAQPQPTPILPTPVP